MAVGVNECHFTGVIDRLSVKDLQSGNVVANFSLTVEVPMKNKDGDEFTQKAFPKFEAWNDKAKLLVDNEGKVADIMGRYKVDKDDDDNYYHKFVATRVTILGSAEGAVQAGDDQPF